MRKVGSLGGLTVKFSDAMRATDDEDTSESATPHDVRWNALLYRFCIRYAIKSAP